MKISIVLILVAVAGLCGWSGEEVKLPAAEPLTAAPEALRAIYGMEAGPYVVEKRADLHLDAPHRALELNLYYPLLPSEQALPLLLFSHGNWSNKDSYDRVINHWVSHGYIVVAPNHLDCCGMLRGLLKSVRYGQVGLIEERIADFSFILDNLNLLEELAPALVARIDPNAIAATGHSFGGLTSQQFGGAGIFDPDQDRYLYYRDERIKAIVAISPPGTMGELITERSWEELDQPMLLTTGTWDSNAQFWPDWRAHLLSFETAQPGNNFALVTQGADHYLGNLICTLDRDVAPQDDALKMLNSVTVAFLDARLKNSAAAAAFLNGDDLRRITRGFSVVERR